ncbi:MAG: GNAT family N-acetyltransferase [Chloroflexi bacterium]|nr:GNAT family N-acetyltransferase [Chloroflexota bacterium]
MTADEPRLSIRPATPSDGEALVSLIRGFARYEKLDPPDDAAAARLVAELNEHPSRFDCLLAEIDGAAVGYALFFETYSTFRGQPKLYLEDIFVDPGHRSTGAGFALFSAVAREAVRRDCAALEWAVLDWNRLALDFYEKLGGNRQREWLPYRLERDDLDRIASGGGA